MNTYTNHPWIAIDTATRDSLHLNHKEVFVIENFSRNIRVGNMRRTVTQADIRIRVVITLPLNPLKICAMKAVCDLLRDAQKITLLEIPNNLKYDLKKLFEYKSRNLNIIER